MSRFDQCDETCTADCGHCKGRPVAALRSEVERLTRERDEAKAHQAEAEAVIIRTQDALTVDHWAWWILDDYDGSHDSVQALKRERDGAIEARDSLSSQLAEARAVVEAAKAWKVAGGGGQSHNLFSPTDAENALEDAVDDFEARAKLGES